MAGTAPGPAGNGGSGAVGTIRVVALRAFAAGLSLPLVSGPGDLAGAARSGSEGGVAGRGARCQGEAASAGRLCGWFSPFAGRVGRRRRLRPHPPGGSGLAVGSSAALPAGSGAEGAAGGGQAVAVAVPCRSCPGEGGVGAAGVGAGETHPGLLGCACASLPPANKEGRRLATRPRSHIAGGEGGTPHPCCPPLPATFPSPRLLTPPLALGPAEQRRGLPRSGWGRAGSIVCSLRPPHLLAPPGARGSSRAAPRGQVAFRTPLRWAAAGPSPCPARPVR